MKRNYTTLLGLATLAASVLPTQTEASISKQSHSQNPSLPKSKLYWGNNYGLREPTPSRNFVIEDGHVNERIFL